MIGSVLLHKEIGTTELNTGRRRIHYGHSLGPLQLGRYHNHKSHFVVMSSANMSQISLGAMLSPA